MDHVKVPGANAASVHSGIWNLAFSALLRARTGLSRFAHSILAKRTFAKKEPSEALWPMPLPYPEVHRRGAQRSTPGAMDKLGANYVVLILNWYHVGERLVDAGDFCLGTKLSPKQWSTVHRLLPLVKTWNEQGLVEAADMGRNAAKMESVEDELGRLEEAAFRLGDEHKSYFLRRQDEQSNVGFKGSPGVAVGHLGGGGVEHVAKNVEPERLHFHGVPSFDPRPYLDNQNRSVYEQPLQHAAWVDPEDPRLPQVKLRCEAGKKVRVLEKLDEVRRLALFNEEDCRKGFSNGLFAIPKDGVRDRMILDARRPNFCEESERRWIFSLGSLQQMGHIFIKPDEEIRLHAEDLREFYHCFKISEERRKRNILAGSYKPGELEHLHCFREELWQARRIVGALDTLAMGDTNAVAFGQVSHLSLLLRTGLVRLEDFISLKMRPGRRSWHAGLMIDDFLVLERTRKGERDEEVAELVREVRKAYEAAGLPRHPTKAVEGELQGEVWGAQLEGSLGILRPSLKKLVPLAGLTLKVVELGHSTVGLLEVLAGSYIAAFQMRRRLMSSLEQIYGAQRHRSRDTIVRLSPALKAELLGIVGLLVVAVVDFRLVPSKRLVASDASSNCEAAAATYVGVRRTEEFQRHALQKGLWNRLLSPEAAYLKTRGQLAEDEELPDDAYRMHPLWEEAVSCCQFQQLGRKRWIHTKRHINLGEVAAALAAEAVIGGQEPGHYYVHLQDSQVSLACLVKGRSSSSSINRLLRSSIAMHVGQNIRPFYGFVRSKLNPSDDPTRGQALRKPAREHAAWWHEIEAGRFEAMDAYLESRGCHPMQTSGLPDEAELRPDLEMDFRSGAEEKKERVKHLKEKKKERDRRAQLAEAAEKLRGVRAEDEEQRTKREETEAEIQRTQKGASVLEASKRGVEADECCEPRGEPASGVCRKPEAAEDEKRSRGLSEEMRKTLKRFDPKQFIVNEAFCNLEEAFDAGPGHLDLFSGKRGFPQALVMAGCPWAVCFDLRDGESQDLLRAQLQLDLRKLLSSGCFRAMAAGPVCASFSTAITPPWRTLTEPRGRADLGALQRAKLELGHKQLLFVLSLVRICLASGIVFFVENPDGSWIWKLDRELSWDDILQDPTVGDFRVDQCRFGTPWRKRTKFRTNCQGRFQRVLCECSRPHIQLRGRCKEKKMNFTKLAESYPKKLCKTLAAMFVVDAGWKPCRRNVSVSEVVRDVSRRIGEAGNPGPRQPRGPRNQNIDDFLLLEPQTVAIRSKLWSGFEDWSMRHLGISDSEQLILSPPVFAKALEAYGKHQFTLGMPLQYYRQLLAHCQREYPLLKPVLGCAWNVLSRWQIAEPLQHRTPIPEPLVLAVAVLGYLWKWPRFSSVVLLSFYGILRIGEALRAVRGDLLTPIDLLDDSEKIYLRISQPKSRRRGPRIQYSTFENRELMPLLLDTWQNLAANEKLCECSANSFRRRWDSVLAKLGVQAHHRLTPGSLRGGGAVAAHKKGTGISDLLWRMRLQNQKTLSYYLQEMTAVSLLPMLSSESRANIAVLQRLIPLLSEAVRSAQDSCS